MITGLVVGEWTELMARIGRNTQTTVVRKEKLRVSQWQQHIHWHDCAGLIRVLGKEMIEVRVQV